MEGLLPVVAVLLFWRTAAATSVALVLAVALAVHVSWFTGGHGLALVLFSFGAGLLWEASARSQVEERATAAAVKLSAPVAALALAFFGAVAGAWASAAAGSLVAGALALVIGAAAVGLYNARMERRAFAWAPFARSAAPLLLGLACVSIFGALRA